MADRHVDQRLAAILAADVAGYSRLMEADERATVATLDACRAVFQEHVSGNGGRIVDTAGDSVLAVFASAIGAVEAAIEIQNELGRRNEPLPEGQRMRFRIGVNLGDVIEKDDGSVYGSGVNVAARLEGLAEPGGICLSGSAHEQVEGKIDLGFQDIGEHEVKNIARPVRAYRIGANVAAAPSEKPPVQSDRFSIAVLPFDNLSSDPEQEFFADGITEDIITGLSRFKNLNVVARNSTFRYKGQSVDVREVGRELGARYVLEGSVRKAGNSVRVTAQLLDASDGNHLWADTFDRTLSDTSVFQIQDEIAERLGSVIGDLYGVLSQLSFEKVKGQVPGNLDSGQSVALANAYYRTLAPEDHLRARDVMERAVEQDPANANVWALLCHLYCDEFWLGHNRLADPLDRALDAGQRAVELDPNSDRTRSALAKVLIVRGEIGAFRAEAERVLTLNPNSGTRLVMMGQFLTMAGDWDRGIELVEKGIGLSAFTLGYHHLPLFLDHYRKGEDENALGEVERFDMPRLWITHAFSAAACGQLGRNDEARKAVDRLLDLNKWFSEEAREALLRFVRFQDLTDRLIEGLRKAGLDIPDEPTTAD